MNQLIKYSDMIDIEKIINVYHIIKKNTKNREKLFNFEMFYSCNIISIYVILKNRKYRHSAYNIFLIQEPKYRIIMSEIMSDKIVNHLISKYVLNPLILPKLIEQNVATRKNKGTKAGLKFVKEYINKLKMNYENIYVLKCDIKKYFYNIDHNLILKKMRHIIKDDDIYDMLQNIICSTDDDYVNERIKKVVDKEIERIQNLNISNKEKRIQELKDIPYYKKGKGLPIGNMTSQILAIYYLNDLDHFVKEKLHCKYYIRYMDDFIIFHYDKEYLKKVKNFIEKKIKEYKLELNSKTNIFNLKNGFGFLGYYFLLKNKRLIIKINSSTKKRIKKKMKKLKQINADNYNLVRASYMGYLQYAHSKNLLKKMDL